MEAPLPGGLGGTYAGSPIGCAAALAVIDVIAEQDLVDRAKQIGALFRNQAYQHYKPGTPMSSVISAVRRGAMIAMELVKNGDPGQPDPEFTGSIVTKAYQHGLILLSCGVSGNVIRFLPALTISDELINEGLDIVERCLASSLG